MTETRAQRRFKKCFLPTYSPRDCYEGGWTLETVILDAKSVNRRVDWEGKGNVLLLSMVSDLAYTATRLLREAAPINM